MDHEAQNNLNGEGAQQGVFASIEDAKCVLEALKPLVSELQSAAWVCASSLLAGHKLLVCGNGGSASEAQHFVGELVGRYKSNRRAWPAIALTADSTLLTCIANDYSYEDVFSRQVEAFGRSQDVLVVFTTSGNSPNVLRALEVARSIQVRTIAFLGQGGGAASSLADYALVVPHADTARIQEGHQFLMHSMMDIIEGALTAERDSG